MLLSLLCAENVAQASTIEQDFPTEGTFHWGPFRVRPFLLLRDTGYDSNVFLEDGTATSDFTSTGEGGLKMFSLFRERGAVQVEEVLDYVWYASNGSLSHFNNTFRSRGAYYFKPGVVFAEATLLSLRERPSTEIDYRVRRYERTFGTGWRFVWPHTGLQFRLGDDLYNYETGPGGESIPKALNRVEKRITVTGTRQLLPKTTLLLEWEATRIDFVEGDDLDSSSRRISTGFQLDPSAFIKGSVKGGYETLEPDTSFLKDFRGFVGDAALVYRFSGLTSLAVRGQRQVAFTTALNNLYYLDDSYGATLAQVLAERVAGEVGIDRQKVDFPVDTAACATRQCDPNDPAQFVQGHRTDRLRSYFVGANYRFSNLTRIGLRLGVWERDSSFDFLNRHRMTAQVIYAYNF